MRAVMTVAVSTLSLVLACQAQAASKQDWDECAGTELAVTIRACSRIVSDQASSPSDRADGYSYRAGAYLNQRNFDQAIADYSEAIRLVPRNITAYTGRALAYFHTGNRDQAAADFSVVQHLDSAKAAALAESDSELKQIAALASGRSPRSIDADASVGRHLPRGLGLEEQVVKFLEANPLFANAPPVPAQALSIDSLTQSEADGPYGRDKSFTIGKTQFYLKPLGSGLVRFEVITNGETKTAAPGKPIEISHQVTRRSGISVGNGLIELNSAMFFRNDDRSYKVELEVRQIEKMSGTLFPMKVNNHFSFTTTNQNTTTNQQTSAISLLQHRKQLRNFA
jgi:tetratricopeptide (TPR) repeat protein